MGCQEEGCVCSCQEQEEVKAYFCPTCKSTEVKYVFELSNLYGIVPARKCGACGYTGEFPLLVTNKKELEEKNTLNRKKKTYKTKKIYPIKNKKESKL